MSGRKAIFSISLFLLGFIHLSFCQSVTVISIQTKGLNRTKESIVLRELTFTVGDTIVQNDLGLTIEKNRNNLLNLGLFNEVSINVSEWDTDLHQIQILIEAKESWYVYLLPILDLADRNFNVWWNTHHHSFERINVGAQLDYLNFTGHNDKFKAKMQFGYTPKQEIEYRFPYFNKRQSLGLTVSALHSENKEISYTTVDNVELFLKLDKSKLQERWKSQVTLQYRPSIYVRHEISASLEFLRLDSAILEYNPRLFRDGAITHHELTMHYSFEYDDRDLKIYPSKGIKAQIETEKIGWGKNDDENLMTATGSMEWNGQLGKHFQQRLSGIGQYSLSRSQPSFMHYRGLGYAQKYVRGYELYVIDGLDFVLGKYQLSYNLLSTKVSLGQLIPVEQFRSMQLQLFLSLFVETGYVNDPYTKDVNSLANIWLRGGGFGLDILIYHNFLFQLNLNTNNRGEWGFFIHNKTSF
ncbi:MAG: BamA/TamA family outer membrane protein [Saprospiraceae bacterium]